MQVDQIPSGYKLTEVGIIPSDWDVKKLGDISDVIMGQSPDSKNYNTQEKGVPLIQGNADIINRKSIKRVFTTEITKTCEKGDIVMTVRAPVGAIGISSDYSCIGRGVCSFKLKSVNQNYFFHLMVFYEKKCESLGQGSTFTAVNSIDIKNIEIPLPPIEEQKRIAQVLSDIDELIRSLDELIIKKRNIKQGTMQLLLTGKQRLPGYSVQILSNYKLTEIGIIPSDWEILNFSELGVVIDGDRGNNYPSNGDFFYDGHCLFLSAKNVTKSGFQFLECLFINEKKDNLLGQGKLQRNDIVLTTRGTVGNIALFDQSVKFNNIRINSGMVILRNKTNKLNVNYLYMVFRSMVLQNQINRLVFGSAQPQLTVKIINQLKIPIPPLEEQKAIARILSDMDEEIEVLEQKRNKYQDIKKGMMQELLTGKTRLV